MLSDKVPNDKLPTLEERMEDVLAVLDAVGSRRTALFGISEGGAMAALFAATYPGRTSALILWGAWARAFSASDYPWGFDPSAFQQRVEAVRRAWGTPASAAIPAPSLAKDEAFAGWWAKYNRMAASPGAVAALMRMAFEGDVRSVLPLISCPTLVVHRTLDPFATCGMDATSQLTYPMHGSWNYLAAIICTMSVTRRITTMRSSCS